MIPIENVIADIEKKFKTTMIGSLARFEESFGHLWEEEGPDQQEYLDLWEYTRNSVLNNGNKQMRAAINEISNTFLYSHKSKVTYKFNNNRNEGDQ
jgi:hypothetical protein